jgi:hypothetical protein
MASFETADCPTKLALAEQDKAGKKVQTGTLTLTVRNATERQRTARIKVEPDSGAKPDWFAIQGAPATSPGEIEQDFAAKGSQTVRVNVTVPTGEAPKTCLLRVVVMEESDPGNDFVKSPDVAFDIKAWSVPKPPNGKHIPWWVFAAAAVVLLAVVGGVLAIVFSQGGPPDIAGLKADAAKAALVNYGIPAGNIQFANDRPTGADPGTVTHAEYPDSTHAKVYLDPGVRVPPAHGRPFDTVAADFLKAGLTLDQVNSENHPDLADGTVARTDPPEGSVVPQGAKESIWVSHKPATVCTVNPILCHHLVVGQATKIDQSKLITELKASRELPESFVAKKPK